MTRLLGRGRPVPGWVAGLVQDAEPGVLPIGSIVEGENFVPLPAGLQETRGGSRVMLTLHDDAGSPNELAHVMLIQPFTPVGAVAIGWSNIQDKHYAYRLTADAAFLTGTEATSRHDLSGGSVLWNNANDPARPVAAELFEKLFVCDAIADYAARNRFFSFSSAGAVVVPTFSFDGGAAEVLRPYCLEEYNGILMIAGYGDGADEDRPEMLRHSFLARSPDATGAGAEGFDKDGYLLLGAKGQRVTALRKGRGLLLAAKANEFYRITGFGRAYPGWQYQVENVQNTLGLGISNPHALTFAEGFWYGMGAQGPLRTDGYVVESLAGPRQRGWRAINQVDSAWVTYCPERRLIFFGVHPSESSPGRSATYPWVLWAWDIVRQVWQTDHKYGTDIFMAAPVATSSAAGPTAPPSVPTAGSIGVGGWTGGFTIGDATAQTEWWIKQGAGGTWTLHATLAPGDNSEAITGRTNHTEYFQKFRHRKNGVTTDYSSEQSVKTLISAPTVAPVGCTGFASLAEVDVYQNATGTTCTVETSPSGAGEWSLETTFTGPFSRVLIHAPTARDVRAKSSDASWPTPDSTFAQTTVDCSGS